MAPTILSVLFFTVAAYAGCTVEKSLFLSDLAGRLELRRHYDFSGPAMSVGLDSIAEMDSDSAPISGHSYCFSCTKTVVIDSNSTSVNYTDLVIAGQTFQACINNETSRMGEISLFAVSVVDWTWCDHCASQTGAFLDLTFNVTNVAQKGGELPKIREEGFRFGSYLVKFPPYYTSKGAIVSMPSGYPMIVPDGLTSYVTIRFERQQESVSEYRYEPLITQVATKSPAQDTPKANSSSTLPIVLGMAIPVIVLGGIAYWWLSMRSKETQEALLTPHYYSGTYASLEESEILGVELEHDQEIARMVPHDMEEEEFSQSRCEGDPFHTKVGDSLEAVQVNM